MTFNYQDVYLNNTSTIVGPYEKKGPLGKYFDLSYSDFYFGTKSWEDAEAKSFVDGVKLLLKKENKQETDIDILVGGDLLNQLVASNYAADTLQIPFVGVYNACATSTLGMLLISNMVEAKQIKNGIVTVTSHNNGAEKQFRYPVEYGGPKRKTTTFTVTGSASCLISNEKRGVKIESATIGTVKDLGIKDAYHMGAVMAPACADTIYKHLKNTGRSIDYYDAIYSGDLGRYGKDILKEYIKKEYGLTLKKYDDTASMIYDLDNQPVYAGGSGPACAPLVTYSYIIPLMKKKKLKRILLVATGALMSQTMVNEKHSIPAIAHAIGLEVLDDLS